MARSALPEAAARVRPGSSSGSRSAGSSGCPRTPWYWDASAVASGTRDGRPLSALDGQPALPRRATAVQVAPPQRRAGRNVPGQRSLDSVAIQDICAAAGVTTGTYGRFDSKDAFFRVMQAMAQQGPHRSLQVLLAKVKEEGGRNGGRWRPGGTRCLPSCGTSCCAITAPCAQRCSKPTAPPGHASRKDGMSSSKRRPRY